MKNEKENSLKLKLFYIFIFYYIKKTFLTLVTFIVLLFTTVLVSANYNLTTKDKQLVEVLTNKVEQVISQRWERFRTTLISSINNLALKHKSNIRVSSILKQVAYSLDNNFEKDLDKILNNLDKDNNQLFSISQINTITKKLENLENINYSRNTSSLNQWNFKAEYFPVKDYKLNTDKIIITIDGKKYELPWVYNETERKRYLDEIKKWGCKWYNNILLKPSDWDCIMARDFSEFLWFSPSWYYILYTIWGYWWTSSKLVDVKTGKVFLDIVWWVSMNTWTKDRSQFIYWLQNWYFSEWWLYITIKWSFPKTKKINDYDILSWYVDDNYIYVKAKIYNANGGAIKKLLIYDLKDLSLVFIKNL